MKHLPGKTYVNAALKAGMTVQYGKGDHVKIYNPSDNTMMVVPLHRELAQGTEHAIARWFLRAGIILAILATVIAIIVPYQFLLSLVGGG